MIIRSEERVGLPSTVRELIGVLISIDQELQVQFDDLGLPIEVYKINGEPEDGELYEFTEWIEIRQGE